MSSVSSPAVAVIVLYYNTYRLTSACLKSINGSDYQNIQTVLVDNNSLIEPVSLLTSEYDIEHLVKLPTNLGFSAGINAGIKYALQVIKPAYIALVNSDLRLHPACLSNSVHQLDQLRKYLPVSALTGKIMFDEPNSHLIWQAGGHINNLFASGVGYGFKETDNGQYSISRLTGWASGAYSVFPSETFLEYGLFDEAYFFGQEEWDFSTRLLREGSYIYYSHNSLSWHKVGGSYKGHNPTLNTYNGYLNKVIYARKWVRAFPLWYIIFFLRTILYLPVILYNNCFHVSDILPQAKAIILALINSLYITKVSPSHLARASKVIGTSRTWSQMWTVDATRDL